MTPKEIAKELYEKMEFEMPDVNDDGTQAYQAAKQCALIALGEVIKFANDQYEGDAAAYEDGLLFKIKEEIEKI